MDDRPTHPRQAVDERPSKSQIKRDMHALLVLGRELIALPSTQLDQLPLEERLRDAIDQAKHTRSLEGHRRQVHYVGKLMRRADADTIRAQLAIWKTGSQTQTQQLHHLETLRTQLLEDDAALTQLIEDFPHLDRQALHARIRAARQEARANLALPAGREPARKHYRALYQALKQLTEEPSP